MQADTAEARYNRMATDRSAYERDGEKAADLNIPILLFFPSYIILGLILNPPFAMYSDALIGCDPKTGARLLLLGRSPAQRARTFAFCKSGRMSNARSITLSKCASVVSALSYSRSEVDPTASVPSACGIKCNASANICG